MEIANHVLESVKRLGFKSFDNGLLRDVEMSFDRDEGGELCIKVSLFVDPRTTSEDFDGGILSKFLFETSEICYEEYGNVLPWLDIHEAKEFV